MQTLSLYVHWPFCQSKCPYCDFNSHVRQNIDDKSWAHAYILELIRTHKLTGPRVLKSIFFGGGTPSLMSPDTVFKIIDTACSLWQPMDNMEITLEANPTSVEGKKFNDFHQAGVNRVSIGIQSFNDEGLKFLGRNHCAQEAIKAIEIANQIFPRYSFDLIYGRANQTLNQWIEELNFALQFEPKHLSLYQLTIEEGTAFGRRAQLGEELVCDLGIQADMYESTNHIMEKNHMPAYEISNYALKNHQSQHNLTYWCYQDYAGIGPGAHGRLTIVNEKDNKIEKMGTYQKRAPEAWLNKVLNHGNGDQEVISINEQEQALEAIMMGLRLTTGIDTTHLPIPIDSILNKKNVDLLIAKKELIWDGPNIKLSKNGRQRLNSILKFIIA